MPGYDGTGPAGQGPMTGGGRGDCVVDADERRVTGFARLGLGRRAVRGRVVGRGLGLGLGRGGRIGRGGWL